MFINIRIVNSKLTLTIEEEIVKLAKVYAKKKGRSLSDLIENYLITITSSEKVTEQLTTKVKKLKGSINLSTELDDKQAYTDYLTEKHQ